MIHIQTVKKKKMNKFHHHHLIWLFSLINHQTHLNKILWWNEKDLFRSFTASWSKLCFGALFQLILVRGALEDNNTAPSWTLPSIKPHFNLFSVEMPSFRWCAGVLISSMDPKLGTAITLFFGVESACWSTCSQSKFYHIMKILVNKAIYGHDDHG